MINCSNFVDLFSKWYKTNMTVTEENIENKDFYSNIIKNTMPICCDDVYEDDEIVITNILKGCYLTSLESLTGQLEKFEWIEVKLGFKDENSNIVDCRTIGYEL